MLLHAGGFLWTCGFVLVLCILFGTFIEDNVFWLIISGAGAILFSAYLLYDLQKLMGGRYLAVHPDDYIYAAVQVCAVINYVLLVCAAAEQLPSYHFSAMGFITDRVAFCNTIQVWSADFRSRI